MKRGMIQDGNAHDSRPRSGARGGVPAGGPGGPGARPGAGPMSRLLDAFGSVWCGVALLFLLFAGVGILTTFAAGFVASLVIPGVARNDRLTVWT